MTQSSKQSGFTLLELIIVIAIFSLIVLMLTNGQRFALRAWEAQERRIQAQADVGAIQNALRQLLSSGRQFEGDRGTLHWVGPLPRALDRAGLFDIDMILDEQRLLLEWKPHFAGPSAKPEWQRATLASDVTGFEIAYYQAGGSTPGGWAETVMKDKKPALIRISAALAQGRWPPLTIAPMLEPPPSPAASPDPDAVDKTPADQSTRSDPDSN